MQYIKVMLDVLSLRVYMVGIARYGKPLSIILEEENWIFKEVEVAEKIEIKLSKIIFLRFTFITTI